jgi:SpoVK/Ycf46/Vps4 family AAA+-type ATPase
MTTADQVKALIRSHADGDDTRFYGIAMQVAAQAARSGHGKFAQELRELVDHMKGSAEAVEPARGPQPVPLAQPRGELAGLPTVSYPKTRVADMMLTDALRTRLQRILGEQRERDRLRGHGFSPMRKLLLVGPPGTGKTMTAAALAGELGLPLFSIQLDGLITKYMGETAAKLRLVFDALQSTRGVYLFDEFDAFGAERGTKNDVGEIRRVLNSFLQFLEQDDSDALLDHCTSVRNSELALALDERGAATLGPVAPGKPGHTIRTPRLPRSAASEGNRTLAGASCYRFAVHICGCGLVRCCQPSGHAGGA